MFNEFNRGGYLLYRLWPQQGVLLDSQTDFYGEAAVREYQAGWEVYVDEASVILRRR